MNILLPTEPDHMLVIARHAEDVGWRFATDLARQTIVQKDVDLPNRGREASSYLWYILTRILPDAGHHIETITFAQGDPRPHTDQLCQNPMGPLGRTDRHGAPHHPGLDMAPLAAVFRIELPAEWEFVSGAQFRIPRRELYRYTAAQYLAAYDLCNQRETGPWEMERLWPLIFTIL